MQDPIYAKIESTPRPTLFAASGFVLLAVVGLWVSTLAGLALGSDDIGLANALYYLPFVIAPVALYMVRHPGLGPGMRLNPLPVPPTLSVLLLAVASMFTASLLTGVWGIALDALGLHSPLGYATPGTRRELMLSVVMLGAIPAVCEELLFRGFVMAAWESRGTAFAIGVTSALFALLHGNLYGLPAYLLVGAVAGYLAFALDSLYAAMVYHTAYNAACLAVSYLAAGQGDAPVSVDAAAVFALGLQALLMTSMMAMSLATLQIRARRLDIAPVPRIRRPLEARDRAMLVAALLAMAASLAALLVMTRGGAR